MKINEKELLQCLEGHSNVLDYLMDVSELQSKLLIAMIQVMKDNGIEVSGLIKRQNLLLEAFDHEAAAIEAYRKRIELVEYKLKPLDSSKKGMM